LAEGKELGLKIIPVGLNYTDPHAFRSDLFVNIGEPIEVADFISKAASNEKEEVRKLVFGFPIFLIGALLNSIPYYLNSAIQKALAIKDSFKGSVNLLLGLVIFTLWYTALVVILWWLTPLNYFSLAVPLIAYLSGTFALVYASVFRYLSRRRKLKNYLI